MAVKSSSIKFDLSVKPVVPVTGVNDQWGHIYVQNKVGVAVGSTVKLTFDPRWRLTTESRPMPAVAGNTATWTLSSVSAMAPSPTDIYYVLRYASAPLPIRDVVLGNFSTSPLSGDANPGDNVVIRNDTVKAGCDPNYIEVVPPACLPLTSATTAMQYTIHFENTGNDTAHNIFVLDTLSPNLNPKTLQVTMASAPMNISMFKNGGYNIVKFDFPAINLLDSSHHGFCDGAVIYTINTLPGLPDKALVAGRVGIYFDTNPVVLTNTVENVVGCPILAVADVENKKFKIYPNPVSDELTIAANNLIYRNLIITNSIGQTLKKQQLVDNTTVLNIRSIPSGLYFIYLFEEDGNYTVEKFSKR